MRFEGIKQDSADARLLEQVSPEIKLFHVSSEQQMNLMNRWKLCFQLEYEAFQLSTCDSLLFLPVSLSAKIYILVFLKNHTNLHTV